MAREFDIIESYVAVWNEADDEERRCGIRAVWVPDGSSCHRLLDARGHEAIEARVRGSWDKWLSEGKYSFRARRAAAHHNTVKLDFVMVSVPDGRIEANGLSFLLLTADGRIARDYQFNPTADEPNDVVDACLAIWNEPDLDRRKRQISEVYGTDGLVFEETAVHEGHAAIAEAAARAHAARSERGYRLWPARSTHAHHNLVKFRWRMANDAAGPAVAAGTDLLVLDEAGRISRHCRFDDAA
jgi:hypothetical protein